MANSWDRFDEARAGEIQDGALRLNGWSGMPHGWSGWPEGFRLLIGVSMQHVQEPPEVGMSTPYQPDNYRSYPFWFTTRVLRADELTPDLAQPLAEAGDMHGNALVLPRYRHHDLLLAYPYGQPLIGEKVPVYLFGWDRNRCARHFGLPLGEFVTDAKGRIRFDAPPERLYLDVPFYHELRDSGTGVEYELSRGVQVPPYDRVQIGMIWRIPRHEYALRIPADAVEDRAVLVGCKRVPCEDGCGTLAGAASPDGWMRFDALDLRLFERVWVQYRNGRQRPLSAGELRRLILDRSVDVSGPR
jgi:hypothetical protein